MTNGKGKKGKDKNDQPLAPVDGSQTPRHDGGAAGGGRGGGNKGKDDKGKGKDKGRGHDKGGAGKGKGNSDWNNNGGGSWGNQGWGDESLNRSPSQNNWSQSQGGTKPSTPRGGGHPDVPTTMATTTYNRLMKIQGTDGKRPCMTYIMRRSHLRSAHTWS